MSQRHDSQPLTDVSQSLAVRAICRFHEQKQPGKRSPSEGVTFIVQSTGRLKKIKSLQIVCHTFTLALDRVRPQLRKALGRLGNRWILQAPPNIECVEAFISELTGRLSLMAPYPVNLWRQQLNISCIKGSFHSGPRIYKSCTRNIFKI